MEEVDIEIQISDIERKCLTLIDNSIKSIQFFYHNTREIKTYRNKPLPTDELPFIISGVNEDKSFEQLKKDSVNWLLKKALEDFILGINLSLVEANKHIQIINLYNGHPLETIEQIEDELLKIEKKVGAKHLPDLMSNLENWLDKSISYKREITSINKARACIAHRDGIIHKKDINDDITQSLKLQWIGYENQILLSNGEWIDSTYEVRKDGLRIEKARIKHIDKHKCYFENDQLTLNPSSLNAIGYTCILFSKELYKEVRIKIENDYPEISFRNS